MGYLSEYRQGMEQITMGVLSTTSFHHLFPGKTKLKHISVVILGKCKTYNKGERK